MNAFRRAPHAPTLAAIAAMLTWATSARADHVVPAVWKKQAVSFVYRGGASVHTCGGLRSQLRVLLDALGAQEGTTITTIECDDSALAHEVSLVIVSPFEADAAALVAPPLRDATEALAARVRGERSPETLATFPARWKTVSFANAMRLRLSPADCELLRQLRREVMPKLAVRVLHDKVRCQSELGSGHRPQLIVAALVAAPEGRD
jgi:hypothetical protein